VCLLQQAGIVIKRDPSFNPSREPIITPKKGMKGLKMGPVGKNCYDPDCGDEAATTVHNCYINRRWWPDTAITCEKENFSRDSNAYGHWSYTTTAWSGEGPCKNFINWENGQGLPDKDKIRNSYASLAHPESQGANISRAD
jgi:hypothetical protein